MKSHFESVIELNILKFQDIQKPILKSSPEKASFDSEAPPLSPPFDFSSKYIINPEKNFQNTRDEFEPAPRTQSQANGPASRVAATRFVDGDNISDSAHAFHLANLKLSPLGSIESFETTEKKGSHGKVSSLKKAFEAQKNVEEIFRQHFPVPIAKKASAPSTEERLVDVHREDNQGLGISIVGES